jgi:hypothetical protein
MPSGPSRRRVRLAAIVAVQLTIMDVSVARAQTQAPPDPPTDSALAAITERGRQLAAYDAVAWHGTDALLAKPADTTDAAAAVDVGLGVPPQLLRPLDLVAVLGLDAVLVLLGAEIEL